MRRLGQVISATIMLLLIVGAGTASYYVFSNYYSRDHAEILNACTGAILLAGDTQSGAMAYDPATGDIYVAVGSNLTVINSSTNAVVRNINVGFPAVSVTYDPANKLVYLGSSLFLNAAFDPASGKLTSLAYNATVPDQYSSYVPSKGVFYVPSIPTDYVEVNATSDRLVSYFRLNQSISDTAYYNATGLVYLADHSNDSILEVMPSTGKIVHNISLGYLAGPMSLTVDPANGYLYVVDGGRINPNGSIVKNFNVTIIDSKTNEIVKTIYGLEAINIVYSQSNHYVYVATPYTLIGIDSKTNSVVYNATFSRTNRSIVNFPTGMVYDPKNSCLYVAGQNGVIAVPTTGS